MYIPWKYQSNEDKSKTILTLVIIAAFILLWTRSSTHWHKAHDLCMELDQMEYSETTSDIPKVATNYTRMIVNRECKGYM